jgi:hypothetical protein
LCSAHVDVHQFQFFSTFLHGDVADDLALCFRDDDLLASASEYATFGSRQTAENLSTSLNVLRESGVPNPTSSSSLVDLAHSTIAGISARVAERIESGA